MRTILLLIILFCTLTFKSCKPDNSAYKAGRLNVEALRLLNEGKTEQAIALFHQAISYTAIPDSTKRILFLNLANAHIVLDKTDSAKLYLKKSIELSPEGSFIFYTSYGQLYLLDSLIEKALNALERAYNLNSEYGPTNNLLGLFYLGAYDPNFYDPRKALSYNLKAYEYIRDANSKYVLAQNYYNLEMVEKSVSLFKELHRDYPNNSHYLSTIIMMEQESGNDASFFLDKLKAFDPEAYQELMDDPVKKGTHTIVW